MRRALLFLLLLMLTPAAAAAAPLKVVASFSIIGDFAAEVGGPDIELTVLVGPGSDPHVYQPRPADAAAVAGADVVLINGFGFEGWIDRLIAASGYSGPLVRTAEEAVRRPFAGDKIDPHAWHDPRRAQTYVRRIAAALAAADPGHAAAYAARADAYVEKLAALDDEIRGLLSTLPHRRIVTAHSGFAYFAASYRLDFLAPQGLSTNAEASAGNVARLIRQIKAQHVNAVFVETVVNPRMLQQIARETGARIGGTLYSDALSPPDGPAGTYLDMMRHNVQTLVAALSQQG